MSGLVFIGILTSVIDYLVQQCSMGIAVFVEISAALLGSMYWKVVVYGFHQ